MSTLAAIILVSIGFGVMAAHDRVPLRLTVLGSALLNALLAVASRWIA